MSKQAEKYLELTYKDSIMPKKYHAWTFDEVTKEMEAYHQSRVNAISAVDMHNQRDLRTSKHGFNAYWHSGYTTCFEWFKEQLLKQ